MQEPTDIAATYPELVGGLLSLLFCSWYYAKKHWLANNVLGICFSVEGIEHLSLGSVQTGAILLSGLFFYDIFWVFCTPVMVGLFHCQSSCDKQASCYAQRCSNMSSSGLVSCPT